MISVKAVDQHDSELTAVLDVEGEPFEVWVRVAGAPIDASPEAFTAMAVPVAMGRGLPVRAPGPVSEQFLAGVRAWQTVFSTWYPDRLAVAPIEASVREASPAARGRAC